MSRIVWSNCCVCKTKRKKCFQFSTHPKSDLSTIQCFRNLCQYYGMFTRCYPTWTKDKL